MDKFFGDVKPMYNIENTPALDILIIPGGNWPKLKENDKINKWLEKVISSKTIILGVCTGSYVLANAGLLKDKDVTSLNEQLSLLKELAPNSRIHKNVAFVKSRNLITCAGAATSIDAALFIVKEFAGLETAKWIAETYLDYFHWDENFNGILN